jgi:pectinesterase
MERVGILWVSNHINPAGWSIWDANTVTANLYYGEYNSRYFNLQPVDVSQRVSWSYQLTQADSATYTFSNVLGTWDPCTVISNICNPQSTSIAVSNLKATKGVSSSQFSWNISWPVDAINYTLYRSDDNINFTSVYNYTEPSDTSVNFNFTDASVPASGSKYYYYLAASKSGYTSHISDTLVISNAANVVVNASAALTLCGFGQTLGTPSPNQTYTISGTNLTDNIIITPPVNFEVSIDNVNWYTNSNALQIVPNSGSVTTTIYIHLNAPVVGSSSGNIINANTGSANISVPVSGVTYPVSTSFLLQHWPLTANNTDSAAVRSSAVLASTSLVNTSINKLYTSDSTQPVASPIPSYSGQYGQALGANTAGNSWTNVGSTLNRNYYEQFTVTAATANSVRIDSITFLSDFYQTTSGIKMAVVYSKNGFTSPADSSEINSGVGPTGTLLPLSTSGTFSKSFSLLRNDAGPVNKYALSLNGAN